MAPATEGSAMKKSTRQEELTGLEAQAQTGSALVIPKSIKIQGDNLLAAVKQLQARVLTTIKDPRAQVTACSVGGGAVTFGIMGGCTGIAVGSTAGAACGLVPALLTFGLSIPVGAVIGGTVGGGAGLTLGAGTGAVGGGVTGNVAYAYRVEIYDTAIYVKCKVVEYKDVAKSETTTAIATAKATAIEKHDQAKAALLDCVKAVNTKATDKCMSAKTEAVKIVELGKTKACEFGAGVKNVVSDKGFQVSAASAAGGAVVCGAGGGAVGAATGTVVGAALGVLPALFTFGLSIPVGAIVGGGSGLALGTAAGGSVGLGAGGAVGYGVYTKRSAIRGAANGTWAKANEYAEYVKDKAQDAATTVTTRIRGATGGTA